MSKKKKKKNKPIITLRTALTAVGKYVGNKGLETPELVAQNLLNFFVINNMFLDDIFDMAKPLWDDEIPAIEELYTPITTIIAEAEKTVSKEILPEKAILGDVVAKEIGYQYTPHKKVLEDDWKRLEQIEDALSEKFEQFRRDKYDILNEISYEIDQRSKRQSFDVRPAAERYIMSYDTYGNVQMLLSAKLKKQNMGTPIPDLRKKLDELKQRRIFLKDEFSEKFYQEISNTLTDLDILEDYYYSFEDNDSPLQPPFSTHFMDEFFRGEYEIVKHLREEYKYLTNVSQKFDMIMLVKDV